MRVGILGHGLELTPELTDVKTMFPLLVHGMERDIRPALIQGSPGVRVTPEGKGMMIEWNALYGYFIDGDMERRRLEYRGPNGNNAYNRETGWSSASKFGHFAFRLALQEIAKRTEGPDRSSLNGTTNIEDMVEIVTDEYYTLEDSIMDIMDEKLMWQPGNIRESVGSYRWIGLGTKLPQSKFPSTRIIIPDIQEGTKPLTFHGHVTPMTEAEDMPITPRTDWAQTSTICGIIHAFVDLQNWTHRMSIWAAHFQKIYGPGMTSLDKLFTAACRIGVTPRLSTNLQIQNTESTYPAYNKLAALAITTKWFSRNYWGGLKGAGTGQHDWSDNVGKVRYWISGTSPATILQGKIQRFARANMVIFGTMAQPTGEVKSEGATGIYYFPVSNELGASHRLCFCALPGEEGATDIELTPTEEPRVYATLDKTTMTLDKNQVLIQTDEQALSNSWYPVTLELSRSVTQLTKFMALGLRRYQRMVRDKRDPVIVKPLELLKTMMIGWDMLYPPSSAVFTGVSTPSVLDEFDDFEIMPGRSA
jgi:hypothetical protein